MSKNPDGKTLWRDTNGHRRWLTAEADALFAFYETDSIRPAGGFWTLDDVGKPLLADKARALHARAHEICFIASSVDFDVRHEPTIVFAAS